MRGLVALSCALTLASGAPSAPLLASGYGAVTHSTGPAPQGHGLVPHGPVQPIHQAYAQPAAPAPYTTLAQGAGSTSVHQPAPIITKQVHYGQTSYVSGYNTRIIKPATPFLPVQVPTVLKGTQTVNAPIIDTQVEVHNVQAPVLVERKVAIPYDAPVFRDNIVQVPHPVHIDAPYNAPYPVPVQGEPIIKKSVAPAVVTHSNHVANAGITSVSQTAPIIKAAAYAAAPAAAYAAAPAAAYAAAPAAAYVH